MKNAVCHHILILIAALFASVVCMGQNGIYVTEGATLYISPNTVVSGLKTIKNPDKEELGTIYVSENTSFTIADNSIFTGRIVKTTFKTSSLKSIAKKHIPVIKKQITAPVQQYAAQLTCLPLSDHKANTEIAISCSGASAPSTSFKSNVSCLFIAVNNQSANALNSKTIQKVFISAGTKTLQVLENNILFARPPTA